MVAFIIRATSFLRHSDFVIRHFLEGTPMHAFHHGELLIGGMALRHLHGELEQEEPLTDSSCWRLAGKLRVSPQHQSQLELQRQYLLKIDDGREGLVELTSVTQSDDALEADFRPRSLPPR
jgi:hypothetical protein